LGNVALKPPNALVGATTHPRSSDSTTAAPAAAGRLFASKGGSALTLKGSYPVHFCMTPGPLPWARQVCPAVLPFPFAVPGNQAEVIQIGHFAPVGGCNEGPVDPRHPRHIALRALVHKIRPFRQPVRGFLPFPRQGLVLFNLGDSRQFEIALEGGRIRQVSSSSMPDHAAA